MQTIALFFLATVAIGGVAWVFLYPLPVGRAEGREAQGHRDVRSASATPTRTARTAQKSRREQVEGTLKELEIRSAKAKSPPLATRIAQAGLTWSKQRFFITGAILGVVAFVLFLLIDAGLLAAAGAGFAAAFGLPLWILLISQEAARGEVPRRHSRMPSTSSCAASRPACRCSTACASSPPTRRSR